MFSAAFVCYALWLSPALLRRRRFSAGFNDMWILVQKGDAEPSEGRAIDHIG